MYSLIERRYLFRYYAVHFQLQGSGITGIFTDRTKVSVLMIHCSFPSERAWDNWYIH